VSDTQAYRQFGNAVVAPVVLQIARSMAPHVVLHSRRRSPEQTGHGIPVQPGAGWSAKSPIDCTGRSDTIA
jgi:DNA (cytosine-5)-methyltransferase 1